MNQTGKTMRFYVKDCAGSGYIWPAGYLQPLHVSIESGRKIK